MMDHGSWKKMGAENLTSSTHLLASDFKE